MRIALIAPAAVPARTANSIQAMKMAQAFTAIGHEARLYVPGVTPDLEWPAIAEHYGLRERFEVRWLPSRPALRRYDFAYRAVWEAQRWGADLIYTRLPQAAAYASWRGYPTVFESHDLPGGFWGPRLLRAFLRGRGAKRLVTISAALAADLALYFRVPAFSPFTVIASDGVDLARYADLPKPEQARRQLDLPSGFTAGYTGHLYPGRGVALILEIAQRLPEVNFLLVGGEPRDVAHWEQQTHRCHLENVRFTGFVPNAQLPRYQAACEVLLMPYQARVAASSGGDIARYLSPMKMFEYLACGRAILSSDLPVLGEVLTPENAILLDPTDAAAWAATIQRLQEDPERRAELGKRARQDAGTYSWEARAERVLEGLDL